MALLTSITALTPNTDVTDPNIFAEFVSDGAGALGFPQLGTNSSVVFRVTFDGLVTTVDAADFTLNPEAIAAGGAIATVVATDATNTVFDVQVVGLGNFDGELTLSISNSQSITGYTGVSPTFTNDRFLLETTQPGIVSILRVSDLNGTLVANPNVNSSSVLFQVQFTEAVRNVDISDFVPIGSAVISGVSVTDFDIANNAISFTDVNGVTYADTYVYTVSGLDGLSGNIGLALSQGVNGIRDVDGTSLINTAPPQGQGLDQTYTINNLSTTPFVSVVASDADAREDRITLTVTEDIIKIGNITSNPNSLLPYDFITVVGSDDRTLTIEVRDKDGDLVNIGTPIASDFVLETLPPSLVIEPVSDLDFTSRDFGVQISGLRFYTGSTSNLLQASGGFDVQNSSGEDVPSSEIASITYFSDPLFSTSITTLNGNDIIYAKITFSTSNIDPTTVNIGGGTSDFVTSVNGLTKVSPTFSISSVAGSNGTYTLGLTETTNVSGTQIRVALNDNTTLAPTTGQSGSDTGEYVITRTGDLTNPLTVNFTFAGTTETTDFQVFDSNGNQLSNTGDSVTIAANQTSTTIRVFANTDLTTEGSETLRLVLSPSSDPNNVYTVQSAAGSASVFISDSFDLQGNDLPIPQVSIVATDPIADEGTGESARFVINIEGNDDAFANPDGLSIALVAGGSAVIGEDYVIEDADGIRFSDLATFINANLTGLAVGVTQVEFFVIPNRDFVAGNRTVTFTIQSS
ncbi:MAG: beta strand repeat-containing protein, partial [Prochlorotrichaceae cyanobacterium]